MLTRYTWRTVVLEAGLWIAALVFLLVPLFLLVNVALKDQFAASTGFSLPDPPTLENFPTAWVDGNIPQAFGTSVFISVLSVTVIVLLSALAAYPLARVSRRWSKLTFAFFVGGLIIPGGLGMIPLYLTMRDLGLLGSIWALVIIYVGGGLPFNIFLYTVFLRAVPRDFEEAALIDGAGSWRTFWSVVFPLVRPVTGTIVILALIGIYNDFFTPLLYLSGSDFTTLPLSLRDFSTQYYTNWAAIFAGLIMAMIPVLIFYLLLQKKIISGFAGGLKG